jgi:acetyl esterase/lipase
VYHRDGGTILRLRRDPFPDDPMASVHLRTFPGTRLDGGVTRMRVQFTGAEKRLNAVLFVPPGSAQRPGVLFLTGTGPGRPPALTAAAQLARRGAVAIVLARPRGGNLGDDVVDARRALDLLAQRKDVDLRRLGVVGYSSGGRTAAVLSGVDLRVKTVGLIDTRSSPAAMRWLRHTQAHLFFQVRPSTLERLIRVAPGRPRVRRYSRGEGLGRIYAGQVAWQSALLRAR